MIVFCAVTNDCFEHIVFMEDTLKDLAKKINRAYSTARTAHSLHRVCGGYKIERVAL